MLETIALICAKTFLVYGTAIILGQDPKSTCICVGPLETSCSIAIVEHYDKQYIKMDLYKDDEFNNPIYTEGKVAVTCMINRKKEKSGKYDNCISMDKKGEKHE